MAVLACESVARGMRDEERTVSVLNAVTGARSFVRVEADFLTDREADFICRWSFEEPQQGLVLIELPQEPAAGSTRLWVRTSDLLRSEKVPA